MLMYTSWKLHHSQYKWSCFTLYIPWCKKSSLKDEIMGLLICIILFVVTCLRALMSWISGPSIYSVKRIISLQLRVYDVHLVSHRSYGSLLQLRTDLISNFPWLRQTIVHHENIRLCFHYPSFVIIILSCPGFKSFKCFDQTKNRGGIIVF